MLKSRGEVLFLLGFILTMITSAHCELIAAHGRIPLGERYVSGVPSSTIPLPIVSPTGLSPLLGPPLVSTLEFSVDAETKTGDYVKVTNAGGVILLKGKSVKVVPWNTVYDTKTRTWVVFLANITSDSFKIMYLYLQNGTGAFNLWYYDYDTSSFDGYVFYGVDSVKNKTSLIPTTRVSRLSIVPEAKSSSGISAFGPTLFIGSQKGLYLNRTETLSLYPLLYREFPSISELWLLIDDHQGRYYYSIFYLFESDREHVLRAHTLRLNDLYLASFENIAAQWMPGLFPYSLSVFSEQSNITTKINGFPFKTDASGRIEIRVPGGDIEVEAQKEASTGSGIRRVFSEWKWLTKSNPTLVRIYQNMDLYPVYKTQFYVSISSSFGSPIGGGWYDEGTTAKLSVEPIIDLSNRTRLVFNGWTGNKDINSQQGAITVDRPMTLRANWRRQYELKVSTKGVPQGVAMNLTINQNQTAVNVPFTCQQWADADSVLKIIIDPIRFTSSKTTFVFVRWQTESGTTVSLPYTMNSPIQIIARYDREEPFSGKITLQTDSTVLLLRDTVTIKGTTSPAQYPTNVTLLWSPDSMLWNPIATLATDSEGNYEYAWKVEPFERLHLKARWTYDPDYEPLESPIVVIMRIGPTDGRTLQWPVFLRNLVGFLENVLLHNEPVTIVRNLVTKVYDVLRWTMTNTLIAPIVSGLLLLIVLMWKRTRRSADSN